MPGLSRIVWLWVAGAAVLAVTGCGALGIVVVVDRALILVGASWAALALATAWCSQRRSARQLVPPLETLAQLIAISVVGVFVQYAAAGTGRPLIDPVLAAVDRALSFDWLRLFSWVLRHPEVLTLLDTVYLSLFFQSMLLCIVAFYKPRRARICLAANVVALTVCLASFALWPAGDAIAYYHPAGIVSPYVALTEARSGGLVTLALGQAQGIIQFPSYHAAAALLLGYAFAGLPRWIAGPAILVEAGLVFSAVPIGGHYIVDVLAGLALGAVSLALAQAYAKRWPRRRPQPGGAPARRDARNRWVSPAVPIGGYRSSPQDG